MTTPILQSRLPLLPWLHPGLWRLPGIQPLDPKDWIVTDDAFAAQMAEKARLIAEDRDAVHALPDAAHPAAGALLRHVLARLADHPGYDLQPDRVTRPDGVSVSIDRDAPLLTLGRLVQEDFCILQKQGDQHVLTAALLCFPASWTLSEKLGRPLDAIHAPVVPYDAQMVLRVQRLFDTIRVEQPLWRMNALLYADPALHQPRGEDDRRPRLGERRFLRAEKQCLVRLPDSDAVVFSIHTWQVRAETIASDDLAALVREGH